MRKNIISISLLIIALGCQNTPQQNNNTNAEPILEKTVHQDSKFVSDFTKKIKSIIASNKFTSFNDLQKQKLDRIEENAGVKLVKANSTPTNGNEIYYHLKERTLYIGEPYISKKYNSTQLINASAFVVHEDGIIVTNYHVIEVKDQVDITGIFASDSEGNVYPVEKILAASQTNDLAILKINTHGKKLKFLSLAPEELMGEDVYMMGHPFGNQFFMTKGIIARKYLSRRSDAPRIAITAEFGQGASGGPVVNSKGEVVGIVSATYMYYTNNSKKNGDLQLIVKEAIPVSILHDYFK